MKKLVEYLQGAHYCVVFTGAGSSTFSGIRDFRGENGIYKESDAERVFSFSHFQSNPAHFYTQAKKIFYNLNEKKPSLVHKECARLEKIGIVKRVITQNIDMLHQRAGSKRVIEVHGSPHTHTCLSCNKTFSFNDIKIMLVTQKVPYCEYCHGLIKPNITFFGEPLPIQSIEDAIFEAYRADVLLVLGTSLIVQPAASLPLYTLQNGGRVIIVNNQKTPLDSLATLKYDSLEKVCTYLNNNLVDVIKK